MRIHVLILLICAYVFGSSLQECDWNYGIPGTHNKYSDDETRRSLIVDGHEADPHEYPWQVSIEPIGCGGSIISRQYILTAAHCQTSRPTVVVGLNKLRIRGTFIPHEQYNDNTITDDIAVIRLDEPLPCDDPTINAIELPEYMPSFDLDDCSAWVTGFGATRYAGPSPPGYEMHEVQTKVWKTSTCNSVDENVYKPLPNTQLCGFTPGNPTEDSCQGDSGGPFKIDVNHESRAFHHYVQVGVVSYGLRCGEFAGIYTDVSEYKDWILSKDPNAQFYQVRECDRHDYHEGIIDCDGTNCQLELPYCANVPNWRSDSGNRCGSYSNGDTSCFADKGNNFFAYEVCSQCTYCRNGQDDTELVLTQSDQCGNGEQEVFYEITTEDWAKEISFTIRVDGEVYCQGFGFQDHQHYNGTCCALSGSAEVSCLDQYGDGWHGAELRIDGVLRCGEFESASFVEEFVINSDGSALHTGSIIGGVLAAVFISAICLCIYFVIWPRFGDKCMEMCERDRSGDIESKMPLSPRVTMGTAPPAVPPQTAPRRNSYWSNFRSKNQNKKNLPRPPSVAARAKQWNTVSIQAGKQNTRKVAPPPVPPVKRFTPSKPKFGQNTIPPKRTQPKAKNVFPPKSFRTIPGKPKVRTLPSKSTRNIASKFEKKPAFAKRNPPASKKEAGVSNLISMFNQK